MDTRKIMLALGATASLGMAGGGVALACDGGGPQGQTTTAADTTTTAADTTTTASSTTATAASTRRATARHAAARRAARRAHAHRRAG